MSSLPILRTLPLVLALLGAANLAVAEEPTPDVEALFADLAVGTTASRARLVQVGSSYPLIRPTSRGRASLDVSAGFISAIPEEPLLAAALAQGITRLDLMERGAPNTAKTEQLADEEALLLLARTGRDPATLKQLLEAASQRLGARHPLARGAARRIAHLEGRTASVPEQAAQLDAAYAAMAGGDYASAVGHLKRLSEAYPVNPEVRTQLGLAHLGHYYASVRPPDAGLRVLEALPELSADSTPELPRTAALLRGLAAPAARTTAGPNRASLDAAHKALASAYKLLPTRIETLAHLVLVESELRALGDEAAPDLERNLKTLQRRARGDDLPASVWRTLALQILLEPGDKTDEHLASATELFERAGDHDSLFNRALLDPAVRANLAPLAPRDAEALGKHAGRSPSSETWPLGSTLVEVHSHVADLAPQPTTRVIVDKATADDQVAGVAGVAASDILSHPFASESTTFYARDVIYCSQVGSLEAPRSAQRLEPGCTHFLQIQTEAP